MVLKDSVKLFPYLLIFSIIFASLTDTNNVPDETKRKISNPGEFKVIRGEREKAQNRTESLTLPRKKSESDDTMYKNPVPNTSRVIIGEGAKVIVGNKLSAKLWYDNVILLSDGILIKDGYGELSKNTNVDNSKETLNAETSLPTELSISKAYPNPFNPTVKINYGFPERADVKILIHDLSGRKIASYTLNQQSAGWHEFNWKALDQMGQTVGSGIYLLTIQTSDMIKKQKITFLK